MLHAREGRMLSDEKLGRLLDTADFNDAAKLLTDSGYPDMSGMDGKQLDETLSKYRASVFAELAGNENARAITDLFRMKYDYHNIKALVKSMGSNTGSDEILSHSGRIQPNVLTDAFISGERSSLPPAMREAISSGVGILSRTSNPQLSDIAIDKLYFQEMSDTAHEIGDKLISGYVRILIDSTNLRTVVRTLRMGRGADFLKSALVPGGNIDISRYSAVSPSGDGLSELFVANPLEKAAQLAPAAIGGGALTPFERECDNGIQYQLSDAKLDGFGATSVVSYLAALENEITAIRMILTGKLSGIAPDIIRERLRNSYV